MKSTKPNSVCRRSQNIKVNVIEIWRDSGDMEYYVLHPSWFQFSQSISFMVSEDSLLEIAAIRFNSGLSSCSRSITGQGYVVLFISLYINTSWMILFHHLKKMISTALTALLKLGSRFILMCETKWIWLYFIVLYKCGNYQFDNFCCFQ